METEDKDIVDKMEEEQKVEQELIDKNKEEIKVNSENEGYIENPGQHFPEDGMMESTCKRTEKILEEIGEVLKKNNILPEVARSLLSQFDKNVNNIFLPLLSFVGEQVVVKFNVSPTDKYGNDNRVWVKKEEAELWKKLREEDTKNET